MKRSMRFLGLILGLAMILTGCGQSASQEEESVITLAAAASLKNCLDGELIPMFREQYPEIQVEATYDSSGKLQAQIEEGAPINVFISAAMKQMEALDEKELIIKDSIKALLENKIVLIVPADSDTFIETFEEIVKMERIAVGDPDSVPAGQYAKEALINLNLWEIVESKASLGTNVTEVLNWVAEGSADAGIVYSTDAAFTDKVKVVAEAPAESVAQIIYPVGIVKSTEGEEAARKFIVFLETEEAKAVFESYGFTANQ
ncbi:molybdate ABC transporter substrate-binding protein [Anoxynatronum buryatiense]|uniref:Molybdate transport system substrate-binding protein n=1 Tax=Anoxynatronum buryatiense TaxID=489973 RepID=A0AA46AIQ3_9CLOT|nr:molybdate ABC transporter substrate-binding protein [Anoxynatronum buryatiense]SMP51864.1 molybdate transport system substrate-binding protein [Anoxynatronum buryatiense]